MKIVIDTNLWISSLLSKSLRLRITHILSHPNIIILGHIQLLKEIKNVIQRPKIQKYIDFTQSESLITLLEDRLDFVSYHSNFHLCRDEEDNYLLALATDNQAQYLITGDKDLLILHPLKNLDIITLSEFEHILNL